MFLVLKSYVQRSEHTYSIILSISNVSSIAYRKIKLLYLPPYSPDLNPIEECFSFIKHFIRRHGVEFRSFIELGDELRPFLFLYRALDTVTADACRGWFSHSGYI